MLARQTNYLYIYIYIMPATRCSGNRDLDLARLSVTTAFLNLYDISLVDRQGILTEFSICTCIAV